MKVPAFPKTASRTSISSWERYWWARTKPTRYFRNSESIVAKDRVAKVVELIQVDEEVSSLGEKGRKAKREDQECEEETASTLTKHGRPESLGSNNSKHQAPQHECQEEPEQPEAMGELAWIVSAIRRRRTRCHKALRRCRS